MTFAGTVQPNQLFVIFLCAAGPFFVLAALSDSPPFVAGKDAAGAAKFECFSTKSYGYNSPDIRSSQGLSLIRKRYRCGVASSGVEGFYTLFVALPKSSISSRRLLHLFFCCKAPSSFRPQSKDGRSGDFPVLPAENPHVALEQTQSGYVFRRGHGGKAPVGFGEAQPYASEARLSFLRRFLWRRKTHWSVRGVLQRRFIRKRHLPRRCTARASKNRATGFGRRCPLAGTIGGRQEQSTPTGRKPYRR